MNSTNTDFDYKNYSHNLQLQIVKLQQQIQDKEMVLLNTFGHNKVLKQNIKKLKLALQKIADPIQYLREEADKTGATLNGDYAVRIANDALWLKDIARQALKKE